VQTSNRILAFAIVLSGCGPEPMPAPHVVHVPLAARCEQLDPEECLLPWPSSRFLEEASDTRTGFRTAIPIEAMPTNESGTPVRPDPWNAWDGFSAMTSMMARFEGTIDDRLSELPRWDEPDAGAEETSPTLLFEVTPSGALVRVPHFAETQPHVDVPGSCAATEPEPAGRTTLYLRPAARLEEDRTYVVAIRGLVEPDGSAVVADAPFAALRDELPTDSPAFEARRAAFERDVFAPLEAAGVDRSELTLAWTFHTASGESAWRDLVAMSERALAMTSLGCGIDAASATEPNPHPRPDISARGYHVRGWFDVPYFLGDTSTDGFAGAGAGLVRDAEGAVATGATTPTRRFHFTAYVPTVETPIPASLPVLVYGHGLFGGRDSVLDHGDATRITPEFGTARLAEEAGLVLVATDMIGLSQADTSAVLGALRDLSAFDVVTDRALQGVIATLVLARVFSGACVDTGAFDIDGVEVVDRGTVFYDGDSLGGIVGPTIAALSPDVHRFVMGVGGVSFPTMIPRSTDFATLGSVLAAYYPRAVERDLLMVMFANHWDRWEGATFAPHVLEARFLDGPAPQVLYQVARFDRGTPEVGAEIAARTMHLPVLDASVRHPPGTTTYDPSSPERGAYVAFDEGNVAPPDAPVVPCDTGPLVHELVRRDPDARAQVVQFLRDGSVVSPAP
jgi:hypothetical protein